MGYSTSFVGRFEITNGPMSKAHAEYLREFSKTRRMQRDIAKLEQCLAKGTFKDPLREAAGLPLGNQGGYFVGGRGYMGQDMDSSILDHNEPPVSQPGLWCSWTVTKDNQSIEWNKAEKFYHYIEWLEYLIVHFLNRWGYQIRGDVSWQGGHKDDKGVIVVRNNRVTVIESGPDPHSTDPPVAGIWV